MEVRVPTEASDSVGRALIATQGAEIVTLRERVSDLERAFAKVRHELNLQSVRDESKAAWE